MKRSRWITTFTPFVLLVFHNPGNIAHAEVWSKAYPVGGVPEITISARYAKVHVHASTTGAIDVRVDSGQRPLGKDGISVEDLQTGNVVNVRVRDESFAKKLWNSGPLTEIELLVPSNSRVSVRVSDGHILVEHLKASLDLVSADGSEEIDDFEGTLRAQIHDGDIRATGQIDGLDVNMNSGHLMLRALPGSTIASKWHINMASGELALGLPKGVGSNLSLHLGSGSIQVDEPLTVQGRMSGKDVLGTVNGGGGLVEANLGTGRIHVTE